MDDLELAIHQAWSRVLPNLLRDPAQLAKRLSRRASKSFQRPPRAWCLVLRANDRRLLKKVQSWKLQEPAELDQLRARRRARGESAHCVNITTAALHNLCSLVTLIPPGQSLDEVAAALGVTPQSLHFSRCHGVFQTHYLPSSATHKRPSPLLYAAHPLDPNAHTFTPPRAFWTWTATYLPNRLPRDFSQTLTRIPAYYDRTRQYNDDDTTPLSSTLYPLPSPPPPRPRPRPRPRHLPPPPPDPVPYKWKDGQYLGYDWRNPYAAANYLRNEQRKERKRTRAREQRAQRPALSLSKGSILFHGWRFLCPQCRRPVKRLYLPVPPIPLLPSQFAIDNSQFSISNPPSRHAKDPLLKLLHAHLATKPPAPTFACKRCHNPVSFRSLHSDSWNLLITYLTAGLLYGSDVPVPSEQSESKGRPYLPRTESHAALRTQVLTLLLANLTEPQIARRLNLSYDRVHYHAKSLYAHHQVNGRRALAAKLDHPLPPKITDRWGLHSRHLLHQRQQVLTLLLQNHTYFQIATALSITYREVDYRAHELYKQHNVHSRRQLAQKFNVTLPAKPKTLPHPSADQHPPPPTLAPSREVRGSPQ